MNAFLFFALLLLFNIDCFCQVSLKKEIKYIKRYQRDDISMLSIPFTRPESVETSIYFNESSSLLADLKSASEQVDMTALNMFRFINLDSAFILSSDQLCKRQIKYSIPELIIRKTEDDTLLLNIACKKAYAVNRFNDTTVLFLTNTLPKTAGMMVYKNISECVIGFKSKTMTVFPEKILEVRFTVNPLNPKDATYVTHTIGIDGQFSELHEQSDFPNFHAVNIKGTVISNRTLQSHAYTVMVVLNKIADCQAYDSKFEKFLSGQKEQNMELLEDLTKLSKDHGLMSIAITEDFAEDLKNLSKAHIHYIPNGAAWKEKLQLYTTPLILILKKGRIIKKLSPFDFSDDSYYNKILKQIKKPH